MGGSLSAAQIQTSVRILRAAFPMAEAIYVFGSAASGQLDTTGDRSDVDIAVLLPHQQAKAAGSLTLSEARFRLQEALGRTVDLLNARAAPIVLQKEIIGRGTCVFAADSSRIEEYEMLVLSLYGKLNEERRGILEQFYASGRAYPV
jgi:predicted nucleotidyltransferase